MDEKEEAMDEKEEAAYMLGRRSAWRSLLGQCLKQLGYDDDPEAARVRWICEREDAISQLRMLCDDFGDNDWDERLHLADVIAKHLANHLNSE